MGGYLESFEKESRSKAESAKRSLKAARNAAVSGTPLRRDGTKRISVARYFGLKAGRLTLSQITL
jgi:hypothetical protein